MILSFLIYFCSSYVPISYPFQPINIYVYHILTIIICTFVLKRKLHIYAKGGWDDQFQKCRDRKTIWLCVRKLWSTYFLSSSSTGIMWLDPLPSTKLGQLSHNCSFPSSIGSILLLLQFNVIAFSYIIQRLSYLLHVHFHSSFIIIFNGLFVQLTDRAFVFHVPTLPFVHRVVGWTVRFMPRPLAWPDLIKSLKPMAKIQRR